MDLPDEPSPGAGAGDDRSGEVVQSLVRGLAVIRAFDATRPRMTLSDVARATGLTRAAARRFLRTLVTVGYVQTDGRLFWLRPRVLELGYAYLSSLSLPQLAHPHLEELSATVGESCSMSVLDGDDVVYVARVAARRIMTVAIDVGTRFPAWATSMGRVLLAGRPPQLLAAQVARADLRPLTPQTITDPAALAAELARVREQGWALVDGELEPGLRAVAAPVRDAGGQVVAAVNVSAQASRWTVADVQARLLPPLLACTERVSADVRTGGVTP